MRIFIITPLVLCVCLLTAVSFADEKSDCLNSCANDKRASDMYCPPAGGFTDEDNKQCLAKNSADFKNCNNACSPPVTPPDEPQPAPAEIPEKTSEDSVAPENSINPEKH